MTIPAAAATIASGSFDLINGWSLNATQMEKYITFRDLAAGGLIEEDFADWLRERLVTAE